jgi:hypothetical protein
MITALGIFIAALAIAFQRTASAAPDDFSDPINLESHNIAFSALYFWVIPAICLSCTVGTSQSELAIPRTLGQLQMTFDQHGQDVLSKIIQDKDRRITKGGIYSWQPDKWRWKPQTIWKWHPDNIKTIQLAGLSFTFVALGLVAAILVSALTPPDGFDCRHIGQLSIFLVWLLSCLSNRLIQTSCNESRFRITFIKDTCSMLGTLIGIILTHIGLFNRCSCWTQWGNAGLALPQEPAVAVILNLRINTWYSGIVFGCIAIELIMFGFIACWFRLAFKVFLQRDDGKSNIDFLQHLDPREWWRSLMKMITSRQSQHARTPDVEDQKLRLIPSSRSWTSEGNEMQEAVQRAADRHSHDSTQVE